MYLLDLPQAEGENLIRWKQFLLNICLLKLREQKHFFELLHLEMPFIFARHVQNTKWRRVILEKAFIHQVTALQYCGIINVLLSWPSV